MNDLFRKLAEVASFNPPVQPHNSAWLGHIPFAAWLITLFKPATFVELGSHWGHSYFAFAEAVKSAGLTTKCYAIDTWQGDEHAGQYGEEVYGYVNAYNNERYSNFSSLLRMPFDNGLDYFSDATIDLLHIDGLHTYEAVKQDFYNWLPKLCPGAVVIFHDTNVREREFGVWRFWEELQRVYPNNIEFTHSHGLGVLQIDGASDDNKLSFLTSDFQDKDLIREYFSALGERQSERYALQEHKNTVVILSHQVSENANQLEILYKEIHERDELIKSLHRTVEDKDAKLISIESSKSWRITQPLRMINKAIKG